ncbi:MAG: tyrosine-type recombinase/integrase [Gammaproteobacteria bacterium]|nr:tyrosine-type recombinase/integrase [Gammaproteobacteria bacterium]MYF58642.1 tyrosine-type recombinase/integrase [Gammaproteobacteria bacterium]
MKHPGPNALSRCIVRFFQEYLPTLRGMSAHTIHSYRDALVLYLRFAAEQRERRVEDLDFDHLTAACVGRFLAYLESERGNSIATRNARLAALHTFARFAVGEYPERMTELQRILGIPFKRTAGRGPVEYLDEAEVEALLKLPREASVSDRRDQALFALMFNTGARVQEVLDITVGDIRLEPPYQVRLRGKGGKTRSCPIWARTAVRLRTLIEQSSSVDADSPLFTNRRGRKLTRFGVRYLLNKRVEACADSVPTLRGKRIHPHSLRHTTAIHLLKAGVDFATISQWLGHATLIPTMQYARADIDTKCQALSQVFPDVMPEPVAGHMSPPQLDMVKWMRRL